MCQASASVHWQGEKVEKDARDFGYTKTEKVLATINEYWRSPLFYTFTDRRENIARTNRTISDINERFEKDAAFRNAYESSTGAIQYMNSFMKARQNDDAIGMEDSEFATHVENIAIMSQLRGTKLERRFNQALDEVANASIDDPATHLELTMIHEVMILDNSGSDLAIYSWANGIKMLLITSLIACMVIPHNLPTLLHVLCYLVVAGIISVAIGTIESGMARIRMSHVFEFIFVMSITALLILALVTYRVYGG